MNYSLPSSKDKKSLNEAYQKLYSLRFNLNLLSIAVIFALSQSGLCSERDPLNWAPKTL